MTDGVFDATVVALSNGDLAGRRTGNCLDRRLGLLESCATGRRRPRYNPRLLLEYRRQVQRIRNDVVEVFLELLERQGVFVRRNQVDRQVFARLRTIRWPAHDQHLVAAALGGNEPEIFTCEERLGRCGAGLRRELGIRVLRV